MVLHSSFLRRWAPYVSNPHFSTPPSFAICRAFSLPLASPRSFCTLLAPLSSFRGLSHGVAAPLPASAPLPTPVCAGGFGRIPSGARCLTAHKTASWAGPRLSDPPLSLLAEALHSAPRHGISAQTSIWASGHASALLSCLHLLLASFLVCPPG